MGSIRISANQQPVSNDKKKQTCPTCTEPFEPRYNGQRYCSQECYHRAPKQAREAVDDLGKFLVAQLQQSGMPQGAFALQVGVSVGTLVALMSGQGRITKRVRAALGKAFGEAFPLPPEPDTQQRCAVCGKWFTVWPSEIERRRFCRDDCAAVARRKRLSPKNELGRFLYREWSKSGKSWSAWSRDIGVSITCIQGLIEGRLPIKKTLDLLEAYFGERLPRTETDSERRAKRIGANKGRYGQTPEARETAAAKMRGRRQSAEHVAKREAALIANGGRERFVQATLRHNQSLEHRVLMSLLGRLLRDPKPSRDQLRGWAQQATQNEAVRAAGWTTRGILAAWRPYLQARELVSKRGRPANEDSHRIIVDLMEKWPEKRPGVLADDFWPEITRLINEAQGLIADNGFAPDFIKATYYQHLSHCTDSELSARSQRLLSHARIGARKRNEP